MTEKKKKRTIEGRRKFITQTAALSTFTIIPNWVLSGRGNIAPSDRINLGYIGAGRQALNLQKAFLKTGEVQITAVCDVYQAKVENFVSEVNFYYAEKTGRAKFQGCQGYEDFRKILNRKDIDAVVIATPDHWHGVLAVMSAEAGKDIYCEKPLSLTISEGRAMVNATRKYNRVFQTGSMQRSWPEFRHTVELIRNGYIGDIQKIKVSIGGPPVPYSLPKESIPPELNWNLWLGPNEYVHYNHELNPVLGDKLWAQWRYYKGLGGGDMTDWGAHMFDIVQWALDMDNGGPTEIIPPDGEEYHFLTYKYHNGITMSREDFGKKHAIQFTGSSGTIDVQRHKLTTFPETLATKKLGDDEKRVYYSDNHYKDFLDAIRKRSEPIADVETGHRSA